MAEVNSKTVENVPDSSLFETEKLAVAWETEEIVYGEETNCFDRAEVT